MCCITFKSGKDLGEETRVEYEESVTCEDCNRRVSDEEAYEEGWQLDPVICPDCLRWTLTALGECCMETPS